MYRERKRDTGANTLMQDKGRHLVLYLAIFFHPTVCFSHISWLLGAVFAGGILISSGELANSFIQTFISGPYQLRPSGSLTDCATLPNLVGEMILPYVIRYCETVQLLCMNRCEMSFPLKMMIPLWWCETRLIKFFTIDWRDFSQIRLTLTLRPSSFIAPFKELTSNK